MQLIERGTPVITLGEALNARPDGGRWPQDLYPERRANAHRGRLAVLDGILAAASGRGLPQVATLSVHADDAGEYLELQLGAEFYRDPRAAIDDWAAALRGTVSVTQASDCSDRVTAVALVEGVRVEVWAYCYSQDGSR